MIIYLFLNEIMNILIGYLLSYLHVVHNELFLKPVKAKIDAM